MQSDRMRKEEYKNWLKVTLSLHYVKEAITDHVQNASLTLHNQLRENIQQTFSTHTAQLPMSCSSCTSKSVRKLYDKQLKRQKWDTSCSPCGVWLKEILRQHIYWPSFVHFAWDNTDPTLWPTDHWEVAKVYQTTGCRDHKKAEHADVAALLSFLINCKPLNQEFACPKYLDEVKTIRNKVMHSCNLEVSNTDMYSWTNTMIYLLEDPKQLSGLRQCKEAVVKIKELQNRQLDVGMDTNLEFRLIQECKEITRSALVKMEELEREVKSEINRISSLEDDMATVKINVKKVEDDNENLKTQVCRLDTHQESTRRRLSHIDLQCQENDQMLRQVVKDVEERDSLANEKLEKATEKVNLCQKKIDTELSRVEKNKRVLEEQSKTLESVSLATETHWHMLKNLGEKLSADSKTGTDDSIKYAERIQHLRQKLIGIYKQNCQQINVSPLAPDVKKDVSEMYVDPDIQVIEPKQETNTDEKSVYRTIFFNGVQECKNIYITGESGVGKSAFCEKIVSVWCSAHSKSSGESLSDDEMIMSKYPLLFYLSLMHATAEASIEEIIENQLVKCDRMSDILERLHCLVILDGLDEWKHCRSRSKRFGNTGVPDKPLYTESTTVTTTRPWKLEHVRLQQNEIDKHVKITGIGSNSSKELVNSVIKMLKETKPRDVTYEMFAEDLEEANLVHFKSIPLVCLQLLHLWYDKKPFGNSQCEIYSNMIELQFKWADLKQYSESLRVCQKLSRNKTTKLPKCFKHNKICQKQSQTLTVLSEFAFNTLFSSPLAKTNVVDHMQTECPGLSKEHIDICLHAGILTQTKVDGVLTERRKSINFSHKTYEEFFAAMYLATLSSEADIDRVLSNCCTVNRILDISDVFRFLFGMNAQVGSSLLQRIMVVISDDDCVHNSRTLDTSALIQKIQTVFMNILEESELNGNKNAQIQLEDLKVDSRNLSKIARHLQSIKTKQMKSLTMNTMQSSYEQNDEYRCIFEKVCKSHLLEKLHLIDNRHFVEVKQIQKLIQNSSQHMKLLRLEYVNLASLSKGLLDIFSLRVLDSLRLSFVYLSHKQIKSLMTFKRQGVGIAKVHLEGIRCVTHGPWDECSYTLNLSSFQVEHLYLSELDVGDIRLDSRGLKAVELGHLVKPHSLSKALRCLVDADKLEHIQCNWCKDKTDVEQLIRTLPLFKNLKTIELSKADIKDYPLRLSPCMENLERVELKKVSISCHVLIDFVKSLPQTGNRLSICLENINITGENGKEVFVSYIQNSREPKFTVLTSENYINFTTVVQNGLADSIRW